MPGVPRDLNVGEITTESIEISWSPPTSDGGDDITEYLVKTEHANNSETVNRVTNLNPFNITTGLDAYSFYIISVAAMNSVGFGSETSLIARTLSLSTLL